jgi:hypothetical protein
MAVSIFWDAMLGVWKKITDTLEEHTASRFRVKE